MFNSVRRNSLKKSQKKFHHSDIGPSEVEADNPELLKIIFFLMFDHVVVYDYEYSQTDGNNPNPVCVTYKDLKTDKVVQQWLVDQ